MKTVLFAAVALIISFFPALAGDVSRVTTAGIYPACMSKEWLDDYIKFDIAKDVASKQAYLGQKKCVFLKAGLDATVVDFGTMFSGSLQIAVQGIKLWTLSEEVKRK